MENNYRLPKDLNESLKNMEDAIIPSLLDSNKRFTIEFNFEGLKFNRIGITIYKILAKNKNVFITYADQGAVALAQRDYPDIKDKIFEPIRAYKIVNFMSENKIAISSGSACSSSSGKPSSTLKNIGLKDDELYSNIRVTLGSINNKSEIDKFLELIQICIDKF